MFESQFLLAREREGKNCKMLSLSISAEKCGCECTPRDLANLQAHQAGQAGQLIEGTNASEEISPGDLRVSE